MATQIFISYSHDNTAQLKAFVDALRPVARQRGWEIWYDDRVTAGRHLDETIKAAIAQSNVFLCFVSQAFLNSKYIREEELPRIRDAVAIRGALNIPVIVEDCHWKTECDGPRSVPLDPRGKLRPLTEWTPQAKGRHAASVQVIAGIEAHLGPPAGSDPAAAPPIPEDEPGPRFGLVGGVYDTVADPVPEDERLSPTQISLHRRLRERLERLAGDLVRAENSHRGLCREFEDYRRFADVEIDELDVASLVSVGAGLEAMVAQFRDYDPAASGTMTEPLEPEIAGGLEALLGDHARLVMGFEDGRDLVQRRAEFRLYGEDLKDVRDRTENVLAEFAARRHLWGRNAWGLIDGTLRALREGAWTARDIVETGAGLAVNGVVGIGRTLAPVLASGATKTATYGGAAWVASTLAGDPNMEAIRSAFMLFVEAGRPFAAIAAGTEVHRFVTWLSDSARQATGRMREVEPKRELGATQDESVGAPTRNPEFSAEAVREMIVRGEEVPDLWVDQVVELNFLGRKDLRDLTALKRFSRLRLLNIGECAISDLSPLLYLNELESLICYSTGVIDLSPLADLTQLVYLNCSFTSVSDLSPLAGLLALSSLDCFGTLVEDLSPLAGLPALSSLDCSLTSVEDLSPLAGVRYLSELNCAGTSVEDLSPLAGLFALSRLDCSNTSVEDLSPLVGLRALSALNCSDTAVEDLSPLARLFALSTLYCDRTSVEDLSPLAGLRALSTLRCSGSSVADLSPLAGLRALSTLDCSGTSVVDLSPLGGLSSLSALDCSRTAVVDLSPLGGLLSLSALDCSGAAVVDLSPLAGLPALSTLDCSRTSVPDLSPISRSTSLAVLDASRLNRIAVWPRAWPTSLRQLNLNGVIWPPGHPLPDVPWMVFPDGSSRRGHGNAPFPFRHWLLDASNTPPPPPPEG